jgi:hypothetical protein
LAVFIADWLACGLVCAWTPADRAKGAANAIKQHKHWASLTAFPLEIVKTSDKSGLCAMRTNVLTIDSTVSTVSSRLFRKNGKIRTPFPFVPFHLFIALRLSYLANRRRSAKMCRDDLSANVWGGRLMQCWQLRPMSAGCGKQSIY